ncbi:MAG: hypothetical protein IJG42_09070 [Muribaculaceae bacterium]|nr:hypothetical protein [Muribaculaceae bacterium]
MKRIIPILLTAALCCGVLSCNEKPKSYRFVKVANDGKEVVEKFVASNDTDALNQYFERMEKIIVENIDKAEEPFKAMFVISPDGDTLNTNKALIEEVMKNVPTVMPMPEATDVPISDAPAEEAPAK